MTILVADEHLHPTQPLPHWQESFYFNWTDLQAGAFGLTRIGYRLDSGEADAVVITMRGGKCELVYAAQNQTVPTTPGEFDTSRGLKVDRLTYTCEEPLKRWRLVLEGRDSFDLTWTARSRTDQGRRRIRNRRANQLTDCQQGWMLSAAGPSRGTHGLRTDHLCRGGPHRHGDAQPTRSPQRLHDRDG
ncbi:hypothetical protein [Janibacter sp. G56]|uniref:hypothetical protein n=1 Tax=Janibacter sp. G56 TaxID=3418717 RepID=UPI003D014AB1